jgi:hypothetical protein
MSGIVEAISSQGSVPSVDHTEGLETTNRFAECRPRTGGSMYDCSSHHFPPPYRSFVRLSSILSASVVLFCSAGLGAPKMRELMLSQVVLGMR